MKDFLFTNFALCISSLGIIFSIINPPDLASVFCFNLVRSNGNFPIRLKLDKHCPCPRCHDPKENYKCKRIEAMVPKIIEGQIMKMGDDRLVLKAMFLVLDGLLVLWWLSTCGYVCWL